MPQLLLLAEQVDRSKVHTCHPKHDGGGDHIAIMGDGIGRATARSWKKSKFTLEYVTVLEHPIGSRNFSPGVFKRRTYKRKDQVDWRSSDDIAELSKQRRCWLDDADHPRTTPPENGELKHEMSEDTDLEYISDGEDLENYWSNQRTLDKYGSQANPHVSVL